MGFQRLNVKAKVKQRLPRRLDLLIPFSLLSWLCNSHMKWISINCELKMQIQMWIVIAYPSSQGERSERADTLML